MPPPLTRPVMVALVSRLAVVPALLMLLAAPLIDLPAAYRLLSAMPSGLNSLVIAHAYGLDMEITAEAVTWSTAIVVRAALLSRLVADLLQHVGDRGRPRRGRARRRVLRACSASPRSSRRRPWPTFTWLERAGHPDPPDAHRARRPSRPAATSPSSSRTSSRPSTPARSSGLRGSARSAATTGAPRAERDRPRRPPGRADASDGRRQTLSARRSTARSAHRPAKPWSAGPGGERSSSMLSPPAGRDRASWARRRTIYHAGVVPTVAAGGEDRGRPPAAGRDLGREQRCRSADASRSRAAIAADALAQARRSPPRSSVSGAIAANSSPPWRKTESFAAHLVQDGRRRSRPAAGSPCGMADGAR